MIEIKVGDDVVGQIKEFVATKSKAFDIPVVEYIEGTTTFPDIMLQCADDSEWWFESMTYGYETDNGTVIMTDEDSNMIMEMTPMIVCEAPIK